MTPSNSLNRDSKEEPVASPNESVCYRKDGQHFFHDMFAISLTLSVCIEREERLWMSVLGPIKMESISLQSL